MDLYHWVRALKRFSRNVRQAVDPILEIVAAVEMLLVRVIVFAGFLYGIYALTRGR
ncbi:MAG: hypothetical protein WBC67_13225 [Candidatus Acidiferrales bacterium]